MAWTVPPIVSGEKNSRIVSARLSGTVMIEVTVGLIDVPAGAVAGAFVVTSTEKVFAPSTGTVQSKSMGAADAVPAVPRTTAVLAARPRTAPAETGRSVKR
ncbi:hypothetical protein GCM10023066_37550 [Nocardioides kongjuensis]